MGMEWEHIGSGRRQVSSGASMTGGAPGMHGVYDNGMHQNQWRQVYVPDPPKLLVQTSYIPARTSPSPYYGGGQRVQMPGGLASASLPSIEWKNLFLGLLRISGAVVILLMAIVAFIVAYMYGERRLVPQPTVSGSNYVYPASEVMKARFFHRANRPVFLIGRNIIVTGDVTDAYVRANGNVTFSGTLSNVHIIDNDWTIRAVSASDSTITAQHIELQNGAKNTIETVTSRPASTTQTHSRHKRRGNAE